MSVTSLVTREETSRARLLVEAGGEREEVVVDAPAQVRGEPRADPVDVVDADPGDHAQRADERREGAQRPVEEPLLAAREALVDHHLQALPDHEDHGGGNGDRHAGQRDAAAIGAEQPEKR